MKTAHTAALVVSIACASGALMAQPAEPTSLADCATIESAVARLDCFDALARREGAMDAPAPRSVPSPSGEGGVAAPRAVTPDAPQASRRDARATDREQRELTSQVAVLREIQPGRLEVTLANGQVWRQTNSDRYNLLVGHEVRIYPSGFGRYFRLTSKETRGFIQVERVR